jgi:uncharacterized protein
MTDELTKKVRRIQSQCAALDGLAIAYSGGVDSTLLAALAHEFMEAGRVQLIIADSPSIPRSELKAAMELASERGWALAVVKTAEMDVPGYQENSGDRCYFCKFELFKEMEAYASAHGITTLAYGSILDDLSDHRPGAKAAAEYQVIAPLQELSKDEIRALSRERDLPTASRASFACLASRLPRGERVTVEKLTKIEMAEEILKAKGFHQYRARHHGDLLRIEVEEGDIARFLDAALRHELLEQLKGLGYRHVSLDLAGYRTGSTN